MPRVESGGRATAVANSHYPKKLISISRQDCVAGAHTCLPRTTIKATQANSIWLVCQFRQLRNIRRDPPRLIFCEQVGGRSPPWLILEIDIGQLLPRVVLHDEGSTNIFGGPGRRTRAVGLTHC
jgi:hypothetical protein